jgi:hypothetical protein
MRKGGEFALLCAALLSLPVHECRLLSEPRRLDSCASGETELTVYVDSARVPSADLFSHSDAYTKVIVNGQSKVSLPAFFDRGAAFCAVMHLVHRNSGRRRSMTTTTRSGTSISCSGASPSLRDH